MPFVNVDAPMTTMMMRRAAHPQVAASWAEAEDEAAQGGLQVNVVVGRIMAAAGAAVAEEVPLRQCRTEVLFGHVVLPWCCLQVTPAPSTPPIAF